MSFAEFMARNDLSTAEAEARHNVIGAAAGPGNGARLRGQPAPKQEV